MILETLLGQRTTQEAAEVLGVAPARYYQLETYALQGMVEALEPRRRGRRVSAEAELERERTEVRRLERDLARQQALYRSAQRALGVPQGNGTTTTSSPKAKAGPTTKAGKAKTVRRRRKVSRGERIAKALVASAKESPSASASPAASASSSSASPASTSSPSSQPSTPTRSTKA